MENEVFNRYEFKYLIRRATYQPLLAALANHMVWDEYGDDAGAYQVTSLYFDTADDQFHWETVNRRPFRQKVRFRVYNSIRPDSVGYAEIKKKHKGVVHKRRTKLTVAQLRCLERLWDIETINLDTVSNRQILEEVRFLFQQYTLVPKVVLSYTRQALRGDDPADNIRVTFDSDLRRRFADLDLAAGGYGELFLPDDFLVLEVKTNSRLPFWLARILSEFHCYKQMFSKYSTSCIARFTVAQTAVDTDEAVGGSV